MEPPDAGVVRLDGEDLADLGPAGRQALRRDRVALVFQGYGLLSLLTARENVELPFRVARRDPGAAAAAATRWLGLLGLADRADQRTDQLSGGERQRVALARALAVEPAVLLVDEPTAELDEENRDRAVGLLRDAADRGAAVVVATHDPEVVDLCDRVVRLVDGRPARVAMEGADPADPAEAEVQGGRAAPNPTGDGAGTQGSDATPGPAGSEAEAQGERAPPDPAGSGAPDSGG